jgi:hypothetical protein
VETKGWWSGSEYKSGEWKWRVEEKVEEQKRKKKSQNNKIICNSR